MAKIGLEYFRLDTNRYQDIRIKRLKKEHGCEGLAVYDYILTEIYRVKGCYMEWDENVLFDISDFFDIEESTINSIILSCCKIGLFNESLLKSGYLSSESIQRRYVEMCTAAKRKDSKVPEFLRITPNVSGSIQEETVKLPEELPKVPEESGFIPEEINKVKYSIVNNSNVVVDSDPTKFQQPTTGVEFEFMTLANCRIIYTTKYQLQWETICMNNKISKEQLKDVLDEFDKWVGTKETHKIPKDYCEHFARWITKEHAQDFIKKLKTPKNERSKYAHFGFE